MIRDRRLIAGLLLLSIGAVVSSILTILTPSAGSPLRMASMGVASATLICAIAFAVVFAKRR